MNARTEFPIDTGSGPLRQCALVLHSIGAEDRKWLLARLKGALVPELEQLVSELQALGIPADPAAAQKVLKHMDPARVSKPSASPMLARDVDAGELLRSRARALGELLQDEPVGLVARVLATREPLEQKAVLSHLDASKRRQVSEWTSLAQASGWSVTLAPASLRAVEQQLALRMGSGHNASAQGRDAAGIMRRALRRLRVPKGWS